jgi:2-polyprenyl-3-methyl-5-hydroxy-6-metoxy-1,4-benzoquinol methylase
MSSSRNAVLEQRVKAAQMSLGISSDPIYAMVERMIETEGLRGDVLDYGAGAGHLTQRLLGLKRFTTITAADIMPIPAEFAGRTHWIEQDLNLALSADDGSFDVVIAAEVIEHLENPRFMIREIWRLLRAGGTAIITTPNNETWRAMLALLGRGHFVAFSDSCYPAHITALLRKDFVRMLKEVGFAPPGFYFSNQGSIPLKPAVTWQQVSFGLLRGLRFSDNILVTATKPE